MPAGYIVSKIQDKKAKPSYVVCSIIFSIWSDLDLFYYYFFDKTGAFHHTYFTHLPIIALSGFFIMFPLIHLQRLKRFSSYYWIFYINWGLHMICDTLTGGILWLYPFSNRLFTIISIPPISRSWIVSFVFHWSFIIELMIVVWAAVIFIKNLKQKK